MRPIGDCAPAATCHATAPYESHSPRCVQLMGQGCGVWGGRGSLCCWLSPACPLHHLLPPPPLLQPHHHLPSQKNSRSSHSPTSGVQPCRFSNRCSSSWTVRALNAGLAQFTAAQYHNALYAAAVLVRLPSRTGCEMWNVYGPTKTAPPLISPYTTTHTVCCASVTPASDPELLASRSVYACTLREGMRPSNTHSTCTHSLHLPYVCLLRHWHIDACPRLDVHICAVHLRSLGSSPDAVKSYRTYPWSPRWPPQEMASRIATFLAAELPLFLGLKPAAPPIATGGTQAAAAAGAAH